MFWTTKLTNYLPIVAYLPCASIANAKQDNVRCVQPTNLPVYCGGCRAVGYCSVTDQAQHRPACTANCRMHVHYLLRRRALSDHWMSTVRIAVVGEGAVGKSCIISRYLDKTFRAGYDPTIADEYTKTVLVHDELVVVNIADCSGQLEYVPLVDASIRLADCCVVVFDLSRESTFKAVSRHIFKIRSLHGSMTDFPVVLVGNKSDAKSEVEEDAINRLVALQRLKFFKASALENYNIDTIFEYIIHNTNRRKLESAQRRCLLL